MASAGLNLIFIIFRGWMNALAELGSSFLFSSCEQESRTQEIAMEA